MATFKGVKVEKGETIPAVVVLKAMGNPPAADPARLAFLMLKFGKALERHLRDEGYAANVRASAAGVAWLTDAEALAFNARRRLHGKRKIRRAGEGFNNITESELSEQERREFDQQQRRTAMEVAAINEVSVMRFATPTKTGRE